MVLSVEGAAGAILVEADGEAVQWFSSDPDRLRLRSAYVAVVLKASRAAALRANLGGFKRLILSYDGAIFVAQEVGLDCVVILELSPQANVAQAIFRTKPSVARLRQEIEG